MITNFFKKLTHNKKVTPSAFTHRSPVNVSQSKMINLQPSLTMTRYYNQFVKEVNPEDLLTVTGHVSLLGLLHTLRDIIEGYGE